MTKSWRSVQTAIFAGFACVATAADTLEIFELKNRTASQIAALINPLLEPGDTIKTDGARLIVYATPQTLAKLRQTINALDRAVPELLVAARRVRLPSVAMQPQPDARGRPSPAPPRRRVTRRGELTNHQVRILEGQQAFIHSGQHAATPGWLVIYPPYALVGGNNEVPEYSEGYFITPHLSGEDVLLDVRHQRYGDHATGNSTQETSALAVRVRGRLGDWIPIGGAHRAATVPGRVGNARVATTAGSDYSIEIKVETVPR